MDVWMYVCTNACMYVYLIACMYSVCIHTHIYIMDNGGDMVPNGNSWKDHT